MAQETWVQSLVESYQRLKKWHLMPPCLTLIIIRSRVKWRNPREGVAPFPTPWFSSYRKGSHQVTLELCRPLYLLCIGKLALLSIARTDSVCDSAVLQHYFLQMSKKLNTECRYHGIYKNKKMNFCALYSTWLSEHRILTYFPDTFSNEFKYSLNLLNA